MASAVMHTKSLIVNLCDAIWHLIFHTSASIWELPIALHTGAVRLWTAHVHKL